MVCHGGAVYCCLLACWDLAGALPDARGEDELFFVLLLLLPGALPFFLMEIPLRLLLLLFLDLFPELRRGAAKCNRVLDAAIIEKLCFFLDDTAGERMQ